MNRLALAVVVLCGCAAERVLLPLPPLRAAAPPKVSWWASPSPAPSCVQRNPSAALEGEAADSPQWPHVWSPDCLPAARVLADQDLLAAAAVTLDAPGPGLRTLTGVARGLVLGPAGWKRRSATWALRVDFERAGVQGSVLLDAVTGVRLTGDDGRFAPTSGQVFVAVPTQEWGGAEAPTPPRPPNLETVALLALDRRPGGRLDSVEAVVFSTRCVALEGGCAAPRELLRLYCDASQREGCIEPLAREFERKVLPQVEAQQRPFVALARRGADIRWLADGAAALAFLGHPLASSLEARLFLFASGVSVPELRADEELFGAPYYPFPDLTKPLTAGSCSGFYLELDGRRAPICLPSVPCHPPTAKQRAALGKSPDGVPERVCETGDGGFSFVVNAGGCPCGLVYRDGQLIRRSCAPCAHRGP